MNSKKIFIICFATIFLPLFPNTEEEFIKKHLPPKKLQKQLDSIFSEKKFFKAFLLQNHPSCSEDKKLLLEKKYSELKKFKIIRVSEQKKQNKSANKTVIPTFDHLRIITIHENISSYVQELRILRKFSLDR